MECEVIQVFSDKVVEVEIVVVECEVIQVFNEVEIVVIEC